MLEIRVSNVAVRAIPESLRLHIHAMHEDNDLSGRDAALCRARWIETYAPGAFVLINTGDYVTPPCWHYTTGACYRAYVRCERSNECAVYDPHYHLYLLPTYIWTICEHAVMDIDTSWRGWGASCKQTNPLPPTVPTLHPDLFTPKEP